MSRHLSVHRRTVLGAMMAAAAAGTMAGCNFANSPDPEGGADIKTLRQSMRPVAAMDPHLANPGSATGNVIQQGVQEGLLITDAEGAEALPGVATGYEVSDDGLTYTLPLRTDAKWSNGDPIVADDFVWNWKRLLSPDLERPGAAPYNANVGVKGAAAYLGGTLSNFDEVGVKALDEHTMEFTLDHPDPDFPFYLAGWRTMPLHPGTVDANPTDWFNPETWVGNGPFVITDWRPNSGATLTRNENYWDSDNIKIDRWEIRFSDAGDSAEMLAYQAKEIDLFRVIDDITAVTNDPALADHLKVSKTGQFRCLCLLSGESEELRDLRVRQALSLAIDRDAIAELNRPDEPGTCLIPSAVKGYERVPQHTFDLDKAEALLADAGFAGGKGLPELMLLLPRPAIWVEAIVPMWAKLGVKAKIDTVETGVFLERWRVMQPKGYNGFAYGNFGVIPTTFNNATQLGVNQAIGDSLMAPDAIREIDPIAKSRKPDEQARAAEIRAEHGDPGWMKYLQLMEEARTTTDPGERDATLVAAATAREETYVQIPVLFGGYTMLASPTITGLEIKAYPTVFNTKGVSIDAAAE